MSEREDDDLFDAAGRSEREKLELKLGTYDGPLDMLLDLARAQKVDLSQISMLELAEQYLIFLREARRLRLDVAAEYLVMAAWLAFMKSRMLLPAPPEDDEPTGEEMAAYLAFQLERLAAMRRVSDDLFARPRLGETFFARGEVERRVVTTRVEWTATQHELLMAYARQRTRKHFTPLHFERRAVVAIDQALLRLRQALDSSIGWDELAAYLPEEWREDAHLRSAVASTFAAMLELAKHGKADIRQDEPFGPIFVAPRLPDEATARVTARSAEEPRPASSRRAEASPRLAGRRVRRGNAA